MSIFSTSIKKSNHTIIERREVKIKSDNKNNKGSAQYGLKEGWTRGTFIIRKKYLNKIKALSFIERRDIKLIIDEIFENYLKDKNIKPIKRKEL